MPVPQGVEAEALDEIGRLLKFAAENAKQLPEELVLTIAQSWEAREAQQWTPQVAARFWVAYNAITQLIKPVTLDSLEGNAPILTTRRWVFWGEPARISQSKRSVQTYLNILMATLLLAIFLQFVVSTASSLSVEVDDLQKANDRTIESMADALSSIAEMGSKEFSVAVLTPDQKRTVDMINSGMKKAWYVSDQIGTKVTVFGYVTLPWSIDSYTRQSYFDFKSAQAMAEAIERYYSDRSYVLSFKERGNFVIKIINAVVLPLLLGTIGACAYVTRLISDQIKDSTFSMTSPVRHRVRVALGALAGVVVGFGWFSTGLTASTLALAFAAGYAIEPVFATVDGIAEKFRKAA